MIIVCLFVCHFFEYFFMLFPLLYLRAGVCLQIQALLLLINYKLYRVSVGWVGNWLMQPRWTPSMAVELTEMNAAIS